MPLEIVTVPCLSDNYAFLAHDTATGHTSLIDIPDAPPILAELDARGWSLDQVIITHHHWDHIDGLAGVLAEHDARVVGAQADASRLPSLDVAVTEGDTFDIGSQTAHVLDVSGHTIGHIAIHVPGAQAVFTADSLMALGCGRLFEGTHAQMWNSLSKLAQLPIDTIVYSGHEYTASNARFALTVDPDNDALTARCAEISAMRDAMQPTVPSSLQVELATNPFLRAADPSLAAQLGMSGATPLDVFTEIRTRKDAF